MTAPNSGEPEDFETDPIPEEVVDGPRISPDDPALAWEDPEDDEAEDIETEDDEDADADDAEYPATYRSDDQ